MANSNIKRWSVKINDLPPNISTADLTGQLDIAIHRIVIPKQRYFNKCYAYINGFPNEEQANEFTLRWNGMNIYGKRIKCKAHENILTIPSTFHPRRHEQASITDDTKPMNQCDFRVTTDSSSLHSSQNKSFHFSSEADSIQSEQQECHLGIHCAYAFCPWIHPPDWHVCEDGAECNSFDCKASHPEDRKDKCSLGGTCHNDACLLLHPNGRQLRIRGAKCLELESTYVHPSGRPTKCKDGILCDKFNCNRLHPREWDPPDDTNYRNFQSQSSGILKSFRVRMSERESARLPIFRSRTEFCQRLERENLLVVTAETGSGKSTQLPQYAAEYFSDGLVVCTQPRVVAAMSLARRVADEYDGTSEGNSVGYQVGSGNRVQGTNIMFMTDAALIHESQSDPNLSRIR
ncbi:unnamed protein product, partial [Adineta ricciae]